MSKISMYTSTYRYVLTTFSKYRYNATILPIYRYTRIPISSIGTLIYRCFQDIDIFDTSMYRYLWYVDINVNMILQCRCVEISINRNDITHISISSRHIDTFDASIAISIWFFDISILISIYRKKFTASFSTKRAPIFFAPIKICRIFLFDFTNLKRCSG